MKRFYGSRFALPSFSKVFFFLMFWLTFGNRLIAQTPTSVTVVVHGFQPGASSIADWRTFCEAIRRKKGESSTCVYTNAWNVTDNGGWYKISGTSTRPTHIVLLYNWTVVSNEVLNQGGLESFADHLFAALVQPSNVDNITANLLDNNAIDLHFIGHSRGCGLLLQTLRRVAKYYPNTKIDRLTTLDPHPTSQKDKDLWGIRPNSTFDYELRIPNNVVKADNYYRRDVFFYEPITGNFSGVPVVGASLNDQKVEGTMTGLPLSGCCYSLAHSNVHAWYYGTINPQETIVYGSCTANSPPPTNWYPNGRASVGYGATLSDATGTAIATLDASKPALQNVFNGNFDYGSYGWTYNGGSENPTIGSTSAKLGSITNFNEVLTHSSMYFPKKNNLGETNEYLCFAAKYTNPSATDDVVNFRVKFYNKAGTLLSKYEITYEILKKTEYKYFYCPLPKQIKGNVGKFSVEAFKFRSQGSGTITGANGVDILVDDFVLTNKPGDIVLNPGLRESDPNQGITTAQIVDYSNFRALYRDSSENNFTNISNNAWYKSYAQDGAGHGLFEGSDYNNFNPYTALTRGEATAIIVNSALKLKVLRGGNLNISTTNGIFSDVPETHEYFPYIQALRNLGYLNINASNTFNPNDNITLGQFCKLLSLSYWDNANPAATTPNVNAASQFNVVLPANTNPDFRPHIQKVLNTFTAKTRGNKRWAERIFNFKLNTASVGYDNVIDANAILDRVSMTKAMTNVFEFRRNELANTANVSNFITIGEKWELPANTIGSNANFSTITDTDLRITSGAQLPLSAVISNLDNPHFYWSVNGGSLTPNSGAVNFNTVNFTAPQVTVSTTLTLYVYAGSTSGRAVEIVKNLIIDPVGGGGGTGIVAPTQNANSLNLYGETTSSISATWTRGNGQFCLVTCTELSGVPPDQPEYRIYTGNSNFANAPSVFSSSDSKVVYTGTGNNVTVTGLQPNTSYRFIVYEYNGNADVTVRYGFTGALPEQQTRTLRTGIVTTTADFTYPATIIAGFNTTFTSTSTNYTALSWTAPGASSNIATCSVNFPTAGTYNVTLVASNSTTGQSVSITKTVSAVTLASTLPDLSPQNLSLSVSALTAGESVRATCYVNNNSTMAGSQSSNITFRLSTDPIFDENDEGLGQKTYTINAGQSVLVTHNMTLSNIQATGAYYIVAKADYWFGAPNGLITESNESNNTIAIPLRVQAALPDLMIQNVTIPTTTIASGQVILGNMTVRNLGIIELPYSAKGVAYLSVDNQFDPAADVPIGTVFPSGLYANTTVNAAFNLQPSLTMPNGNYYLFIAIDYQGTDYDNNRESNENNNLFTYASQITIANPNQPTTQATNLQLSNITSNGVQLTWTRGNGQSCIVIARSKNNIPQITGDNKNYIANADYTLAQQINYGNDPNGIYRDSRVVYDGTGTSVNVTGLNSNETYTFIVLEYNGTGTSKDYLQTTTNNGVSTHTLYVNNTSFTRMSGAIVSSVRPSAVKFFDQTKGFQYREDNNYAVTNDGGKTWLQKKQFLNGSGWAKESWAGNSGTGWIALDDGDIFKTSDFGHNWTRQVTPVNRYFNDIHFVDANTGYIACRDILNSSTNDGAILKTTNGGATWSILTTISRPIGAVYFLNAQLGWATTFAESSSTNKIILKTTDGGQTWSRSPEIVVTGCFGDLVDIYFTTPQKGVAIAYCGTLLRTIDGGTTWSVSTALPTEYSFAKIQFADSLVGYINRKNARLAKTTDGGATWSLIPIQTDDVTGSLAVLSVLDANTVFVGGTTGILKTSTGAQAQGIKLNSLVQQSICSGSSIQLPVRATGTFDATNNFTVQLSNASGSFSTPTTLTTFTNVGNDSIECALPNTLAQGSNYRLRVLSSSPQLVSDTSNALIINGMPPISVSVTASNGTQICVGTNAPFQATPTNGGNTPNYQWKVNGANVGTNAPTFNTTTLQDGDAIWVEMRSSAACASVTPAQSAPVSMQVTTVNQPFIQTIDNTLASSSTIGNQWFLNGVALIGATTPFYTLMSNAQNGSYTVRVTQNGCSATSQAISFAYAPPSIRTQTLTQTQYCVGATLKLPYSLNGNFNANATFNVELSNGTGSFVAPTLVSSFVTPPVDSITCSLPISLTTGNGYRLRITASNPIAISDTTTPLTITNLPIPTIQVSGHILASSSASGNQWFFNGQAIVGATNQFYTATQTGFYTVRVTQNGCQALSNLLNHIVSATHDLDNGLSVHVFPNPTDGQLWIQLNGVDKATIQIWNAIGQVLKRQDVTQTLTSLDLNALPNGVYYVHIIAANGKLVQKVVLQR